MPIRKLVPNQPTEIALKYVKGKEKNGQWGMQYEYVLTSGEILYLPPIAAAEIEALHPGPCEPFIIRKNATNGTVTYQVERVPQTKNPSGPVKTPNRPMAAENLQPATANGYSTPNRPAPQPISPRAAYSVSPALMDMLGAQLIAADEACAHAENHARLMGRQLQYSNEDRRAIAISCFIGLTQRRAS